MLKKAVPVALFLALGAAMAFADTWPGRDVPVPFPPEASPIGIQHSPDVACSGDECLVVWMGWDDAGAPSYDIRGARVTKIGTVLDSPCFTIASPSFMNTSRPQVVAVNSGYVVFYGGAMYATISRDGKVVERDQTLSFTNRLNSINEAVAAGNSILVFWVANEGPLIPHLTLLDANLRDIRDVKVDGYPQDVAASGSGFVVASTAVEGLKVTRLANDGSLVDTSVIPGQNSTPVIAAAGDSVLMAWRRTATNDAPGSVAFAAITSRGVEPVQLLDRFAGYSASSLDVQSTGDGYLVTWSRPSSGYYSDNVYVQRIGKSGELVDPKPFTVSAKPYLQLMAKAAPVAGGYLVAWADSRYGMGHDHVFGAVVAPAGSIGPDFLLSRRRTSQSNAVLAATSSVVGLAWNEAPGAFGTVMFARAFPDGRLLDDKPVQLNTFPAGPPAIASHDNTFIVLWRERNTLREVTIAADGSVTAPSGTTAPGFGDVSAAAGPNGVAAVWTENANVMWIRTQYGGPFISSIPLAIGVGVNPKIAFDGVNYRVVARAIGSNALVSWRVSTEGTVIDTVPFTVAPEGAERDQLALACGNATCVALWRTADATIEGALLTTSTVIPGIVAARASAVAQPALTRNGESYLLTWTAKQTAATKFNTHAATLSASGNLISADANVTASENDERSPAVAIAGKDPVFAFSRDVSEAGDRLYLRVNGDARRRSVRH